MKMYDGFAEDTWKVNRKLTVTAGVRYDVQLTPAPGLINNNYDPLSAEYTQTIKNVLDRVQPRVGFSYSPFTRTVVRGGYGLFSALNQGSTYYAMRVENGVVQINYNYSGCESSVASVTKARCPTVPSTTSSLQYPNVPFAVTGPSLSSALYPSGGTAPAVKGPSVVGPQSFHGLDPNFVPPYTHEFELIGRAGYARQAYRSVWDMWVPAACGCRSFSTPTWSAKPRMASAATTFMTPTITWSSRLPCRSICLPIVATRHWRASIPDSVWPTPGTTPWPSP